MDNTILIEFDGGFEHYDKESRIEIEGATFTIDINSEEHLNDIINVLTQWKSEAAPVIVVVAEDSTMMYDNNEEYGFVVENMPGV